LVIGRLIPDNNADLIIKGFLKSNSNKKLVIVGDVSYKDSYASNLKKIKDERLVFTGYVKDQDLTS
jgi:glycosyltransferase involved in cell wall biosynthesis